MPIISASAPAPALSAWAAANRRAEDALHAFEHHAEYTARLAAELAAASRALDELSYELDEAQAAESAALHAIAES